MHGWKQIVEKEWAEKKIYSSYSLQTLSITFTELELLCKEKLTSNSGLTYKAGRHISKTCSCTSSGEY